MHAPTHQPTHQLITDHRPPTKSYHHNHLTHSHHSAALNTSTPQGGAEDGRFADVFLVPQRMYMADGTLADQVTYPRRVPKEERTPELERKMMEQLELVGIEYLVERNAKAASGEP